MKRFKGISRSQFMVAACNVSSQAENSEAEKENRQVQNTIPNEEINPSSIVNNSVCQNHNDTLSEAIKHSVLFEPDLTILDMNLLGTSENSGEEGHSLGTVETDMSETLTNDCAQDQIVQSVCILESFNMEKEQQATFFSDLFPYQSHAERDNNAELQVCNSICKKYELPVGAQVENKYGKLHPKEIGAQQILLLAKDDRFSPDIGILRTDEDPLMSAEQEECPDLKENISSSRFPISTDLEDCTGVDDNDICVVLNRGDNILQDIEILEAEVENEVLTMTTEHVHCIGVEENNSSILFETDGTVLNTNDTIDAEVEEQDLPHTTEQEDCKGEGEKNTAIDNVNSETEPDISEKESDMETGEEDIDMKKKRKKSKKIEQSNKRQANIDLRLGGQEYKSMVCKESGKYEEQIRPARMMKNRCKHKSTTPKRPKKKINSKNYDSRTFLCANIDEDLRQTKFQEFWSIKSWDAKRAYLFGLVDKRKPYKRRSNIEQSRKGASFDCYFHDNKGIKIRVCRNFFLNTLALGRDTFNRWLKVGLSNTTEDAREVKPTSRKIQQNKQMRNSVIEWLKIIPKVPSHYCRSSSSRVYVESTFQSKSHMHSVYEQWCKEYNKKHVACRVTFCKIMNDQKISIHKPRKDQCDTCYQYKVGNLSQQDYEDHRNKKEEGREAKAKEKSEISDKKLVITMDLQSVLLCPKLQVSKIYYSQKLQLHDFTIYCLNNGDVFLYVWHEGEGAVTSNEFVSCVSDFIEKRSDQLEEIVLISDGCNYQNRNRVLTSQLSNLAVNKNIIIRQLILEKGHTMMEADSVHSTLENLFMPPICSPGDYVSRMRAARPKHPYTVFQVDHSFFQNYENQPNNFISIRPGRKVGDPTVADIRALRYLPCGKVQFKLRHVDDWADLPQRRPNKPSTQLKPLYKAPRKLKNDKFSALQELKSVIPVEYHPFYDALSHE